MLVIFDFDGTLVDVSERWYQLHRDAANQYALPIIERESYIAAKSHPHFAENDVPFFLDLLRVHRRVH